MTHQGHSISPATILSVLSILLYCAGFIRIEVQLNDHGNRLDSLQDILHTAPVKNGPDERTRRSVESPQVSNDSLAAKKQEVIQKVDSLLEIYQRSVGKVCVRGPPGPPGKTGTQGQQGKRGKAGQKGRRGSRGPPGIMGQPGRSGKQGMTGPSGMRGEKGDKGDAGPQGMMGPQGKPGESISPPQVIISPPNLTINESLVARFQCSATGNPRPLVKWTKENASLPSNRTSVTDLGELLIKNVGLQDTGNYTCSAWNILGKTERFAHLSVQARPRVTLPMAPTYVAEGTNASLPKCHVTGFPSPQITWSKHRGHLSARAVVEDGHLRILKTVQQDSGMYTCQASNILGSDFAITPLVVEVLPTFITKPPEVLNAYKGEDVSVSCRATGSIKPTIEWTKTSGELLTSMLVLADGTLKIAKVALRDAGTYVCTASELGLHLTSQVTMQLNVSETAIPLDSEILRGHPDYAVKLNEYLAPVQASSKQWKLCFRASRHQYSSSAFHAACDNKGPTVTLVRVGNYVFGGYVDKSWNVNGVYIRSIAAFLFSLKNHVNQQYKMLTYRNQQNAIYNSQSRGPTFGGGHDLKIVDKCNANTNSYTYLGHTYRPPNGYAAYSTQAKNLLAGSYKFKCDEYEVFYQV